MLIAQLSDTHITVPGQSARNSYDKIQALKKSVHTINQLSTAPDAVIHTGDLVHNGEEEEYILVKSILDRLGAPYFITCGNRDNAKKARKVFGPKISGEDDADFMNFHVELTNLTLVSIDTSSNTSNLGILDFERLARLDKILMSSTENPTLIFMHHPPVYVSSKEYKDFSFKLERHIRNFAEILDRHPKVIGCLCGHLHRSVKSAIASVPIIVMPPLSNVLRRDGKTNL